MAAELLATASFNIASPAREPAKLEVLKNPTSGPAALPTAHCSIPN